jgi:hypothetical protein
MKCIELEKGGDLGWIWALRSGTETPELANISVANAGVNGVCSGTITCKTLQVNQRTANTSHRRVYNVKKDSVSCSGLLKLDRVACQNQFLKKRKQLRAILRACGSLSISSSIPISSSAPTKPHSQPQRIVARGFLPPNLLFHPLLLLRLRRISLIHITTPHPNSGPESTPTSEHSAEEWINYASHGPAYLFEPLAHYVPDGGELVFDGVAEVVTVGGEGVVDFAAHEFYTYCGIGLAIERICSVMV